MKSGFHLTTSDEQLSSWTGKKFQSTSQSQTCTRKSSWSLAVCCPSDPLQLSESRRNNHKWEICSANRWDAPKTTMTAAGIGHQNGSNSFPKQSPTIRCTANTSKAQQIRLKVCFIHYIYMISCQPATPSSSISTTFHRWNTSTTSRIQKMLSKSWLNPEEWIFVLIVMIPILINKDVFESS